MKEKEFYVLKGEDGNFYPVAFIYPVGQAGEINKEQYEKKNLDEGDQIVKVKMIET